MDDVCGRVNIVFYFSSLVFKVWNSLGLSDGGVCNFFKKLKVVRFL